MNCSANIWRILFGFDVIPESHCNPSLIGNYTWTSIVASTFRQRLLNMYMKRHNYSLGEKRKLSTFCASIIVSWNLRSISMEIPISHRKYVLVIAEIIAGGKKLFPKISSSVMSIMSFFRKPQQKKEIAVPPPPSLLQLLLPQTNTSSLAC